jgi:hypothetical protein
LPLPAFALWPQKQEQSFWAAHQSRPAHPALPKGSFRRVAPVTEKNRFIMVKAFSKGRIRAKKKGALRSHRQTRSFCDGVRQEIFVGLLETYLQKAQPAATNFYCWVNPRAKGVVAPSHLFGVRTEPSNLPYSNATPTCDSWCRFLLGYAQRKLR